MAKISIILPIYNVQEHLRECLESVINQTINDIEIICVNDDSTDYSLEIVKEYAAKDERFVVITGPNGGYGKAMNLGLDVATGTYIGIVEPDDYVALEMFGDLYEVAEQYKLDFVKADFYRFKRDEYGNEERIYEALDSSGLRYNCLLNPSQDPSTVRFKINARSGIYKRSFIEKHTIRYHEISGIYFQDDGFFWQTYIYAERAMIINRPFYRKRQVNFNSSVKSKENVYCMNIEYDHIRSLLMRDSEVWERFKYMYWWKKYFNYRFMFEKIDKQYKREYLLRMQQEFKRAIQKGELRKTEFTLYEWKQICNLAQNADSFYESMHSSSLRGKITPFIPQSLKEFVKKMNRWR